LRQKRSKSHVPFFTLNLTLCTSPMATTQHYLWASGHFLLLISSLKYVWAAITFQTPSPRWYKAALTGALMSYAIVCQKSLGNPQPNIAFVRRSLLDENVQYFLLAFFWWSSKPIVFALFPFMIFSLFHVLTFVRTGLMAQFLPPGSPATPGGPPTPHPIAKKLQSWTKSNFEPAMRVVAYIELLIFARVFIGAITFQSSIIAPIIYAHFLRQRYYQSSFTREALTVTEGKIDSFAHKDGTPPAVGQVWDKIRALIKGWAGNVLAQQPPTAGGAARR